MEKTIKIETNTLLAECLTRMLAEEIINQREWAKTDKHPNMTKTRERIIEQCKEAIKQIENQGIKPYAPNGLYYEYL